MLGISLRIAFICIFKNNLVLTRLNVSVFPGLGKILSQCFTHRMDGPRAGSSAWVEILLEIELDGLRKVGDSFQLELLKKGAELLNAIPKI